MGSLNPVLRKTTGKTSKPRVSSVSLYALVFVILASLIGGRLQKLGVFEKVTTNLEEDRCILVKGIRGAEDITAIATNVYLSSSDDRASLMEFTHTGPSRTPSGGIYRIEIRGENEAPKVKKVHLEGFPDGVVFHPHGIHYHESHRELYVVNHAYGAGGERIDVFFVDTRRGENLQLIYKRSISPPNVAVSYGLFNDIVVTGADELYATQWIPFPQSVNVKTTIPGLLSNLKAVLYSAVLGRKLAAIWRCTGIQTSNAVCEPLESTRGHGIMYNGIAISEDKQQILVADSIQRMIVVFARNKDTGALAWESNVKLPLAPDNIERNRHIKDKEVYTIGSTTAKGHMQLLSNAAHARTVDDITTRSPGGAIFLEKVTPRGGKNTQKKEKEQKVVEKSENFHILKSFVMEGRALSGVSSAVGTVRGGLIMGSWYDDGVLYCPSSVL